MTQQNEPPDESDDKKYVRPKAPDNKHFSELMDLGFSIPTLSTEFCHDTTTIRKWVSGEQPAPLWTVTLAKSIIASKKGAVSRYIVLPNDKEQENFVLTALNMSKIPYKKLEF